MTVNLFPVLNGCELQGMGAMDANPAEKSMIGPVLEVSDIGTVLTPGCFVTMWNLWHFPHYQMLCFSRLVFVKQELPEGLRHSVSTKYE